MTRALTPTDLFIRSEICRRLADGESLNGICKDEGFPAESTVRAWVRDDTGGDGFATNYTRARELGYSRLAEELLAVARSPLLGVIRKTVTKEAKDRQGNIVGEEVETTETETDAVDRARLHADTLKWTLAKMLPKVYGDKNSVELSGPGGGPIQTESTVVTAPLDPIEASRLYLKMMEGR